ncbi:MAG: DUF1684 domain-containing protein [Candidatus Latescibacteria bacterium]|nr:DUF1684 domain-containing protein [Candidatus Latescibacterota bacterium]
MSTKTALAAAILISASAAGGCGPHEAPADPAHLAEVEARHAARIERLRDETGWLTLVGLHPLRDGANTVGSAADAGARLPTAAPARLGVVTADATGYSFEAAAGADVRRIVGGDTLAVTSVAMAPDIPGPPTVLRSGSLLFHVIVRGGRGFLRVKDRESEVRRGFTGIERFPVGGRWRVTARLEPHVPPRGVMVPDVLGNLEESPSPGTLVFTLEGRECRLTPVGGPGEELFIVFADATSGGETYGGGRFLSADPPRPDGTVVLDFNLATNPPCAFTPYATCPLPPQGNTLPVAVRAGEKTWGRH